MIIGVPKSHINDLYNFTQNYAYSSQSWQFHAIHVVFLEFVLALPSTGYIYNHINKIIIIIWDRDLVIDP